MDHVGRLAPTPSGRLHLGNVCAFAGAWLSARAHGGRVLLRIEDVDRVRADRSVEESLRAAADPRRDGAMEAAARRLLAVGADRLPALRVGRSLFWGESQVAGAVAAARLTAAACR